MTIPANMNPTRSLLIGISTALAVISATHAGSINMGPALGTFPAGRSIWHPSVIGWEGLASPKDFMFPESAFATPSYSQTFDRMFRAPTSSIATADLSQGFHRPAPGGY